MLPLTWLSADFDVWTINISLCLAFNQTILDTVVVVVPMNRTNWRNSIILEKSLYGPIKM